MLVKDTDKLAQHAKIARASATKERRDAEVRSAEQKAASAAQAAPEAQRGIRLHSSTIVERLVKLNRNLFIEPSVHSSDVLGVYLLDPTHPGGRRFLVGFDKGYSTEFTTKELNADGTLKRIRPGWRRALMRLIRAKAVTQYAADVMFGPPNADSESWQNFVTK